MGFQQISSHAIPFPMHLSTFFTSINNSLEVGVYVAPSDATLLTTSSRDTRHERGVD